MDIQRFRNLSAQHRALVALSVLLDGMDGSTYLENDAANGEGLRRAASELAQVEPELRMPLAGTLLRTALKEIKPG